MTIIILAITAWFAAVYRRPGARRAAGDWALPATLATLALGLTFKVPAVYSEVGKITGVPNLGQLIKDCSAVLSAFGTQLVLLHLLHGPREAVAQARRRAAAPVLTLMVMTLAFALADTGSTIEELHARLADTGLLEFRGAYLLFLAWAFADIARLCWRFAALAGERALATGLRLIAAGGAVGLAYVASGTVQVLAAGQRDLPLVQRVQHVSDGLIALATLLVILGSTLPALAARFGRTSSAGHDERSGLHSGQRQALEGLWLSLTQSLPEFVLPEAAQVRPSANERLYRQVIEIEDSRLALRPLRDQAVERAAAQAANEQGVRQADRAAAVEGAALALAVRRLRLEARTRGAVARRPVEPEPGPINGERPGARATSLDSEAAWLAEVGLWYSNEGLVSCAQWHLDLMLASDGAQ